ncbi:MAG: hypothetical protein NWF04_07555 [Candidatus Bathyarchaeota archaeon]|nr:hypothetical protein [Candidatus Bathyarchaeota archaeon]
MKPCVLYFSRTGNTKRMAQAIAQALNAPSCSIDSCDLSVVADCDLLVLGTPVEGFRPAKETSAFLEQLPQSDGKKAILFCTYRLFKGSVFRSLDKALRNKGYLTILTVAKKGMKPEEPADFAKEIQEITNKLS